MPPTVTAPAPTTDAKTVREVTAKSAFPGEAILRFQRDPFAFLDWLDGHGGDAVRVRLGPTEAVLLRDPDLVEKVLLAPAGAWPKGPQIEFAARVFGSGLLTNEPPQHTRTRKLVLPAFAHGRIAGYADVVTEIAERTADEWAQRGTMDLVEAATRLSYDIAERTLFGSGGIDDGGDARGSVRETTGKALRYFARVARNPILIALGDRLPIPSIRGLDRCRRELVEIVGRAVHQRRQWDDPGDDILGLLMVAQDEETGDGLSDTEVINEVLTILMAGHETTASALSWVWLLMGEHPEAREIVEQEAATVGDLDLAALRQLEGTRGVLAEAMRLYPPAYLLDRRAERATWLEGMRVARRTTILMSPYLLHRSPDLWDEPEAFRPDRPGLKPKGGKHRVQYVPFSMGTRGCIGERFAWMEGTLALAAVARRVRLHPTGPWPSKLASLTLRPDGAVPVRVEAR